MVGWYDFTENCFFSCKLCHAQVNKNIAARASLSHCGYLTDVDYKPQLRCVHSQWAIVHFLNRSHGGTTGRHWPCFSPLFVFEEKVRRFFEVLMLCAMLRFFSSRDRAALSWDRNTAQASPDGACISRSCNFRARSRDPSEAGRGRGLLSPFPCDLLLESFGLQVWRKGLNESEFVNAICSSSPLPNPPLISSFSGRWLPFLTDYFSFLHCPENDFHDGDEWALRTFGRTSSMPHTPFQNYESNQFLTLLFQFSKAVKVH